MKPPDVCDGCQPLTPKTSKTSDRYILNRLRFVVAWTHGKNQSIRIIHGHVGKCCKHFACVTRFVLRLQIFVVEKFAPMYRVPDERGGGGALLYGMQVASPAAFLGRVSVSDLFFADAKKKSLARGRWEKTATCAAADARDLLDGLLEYK